MREVNEFFIQTHSYHEVQLSLKDFLQKRISKTYKIQCQKYLYYQAMMKNSTFRPLFFGTKEYKAYDDIVIDNFVRRMTTLLTEPEEILIVQGVQEESSEDNFFYILAKGVVKIEIKEHFDNGIEEETTSVLQPGNYFGEVSVIYHCPHSATAISASYDTIAVIDSPRFLELLTLYPSIVNQIRSKMCNYQDPIKVFKEMHLRRISYLQRIPTYILSAIAFIMKHEHLDKGTFLRKKRGEEAKLYLIQSGFIEIFTIVDNELKFVIDKLYRGSILNHTLFLLDEEMPVQIQMKTNVTCWTLEYK